MLAGVPPSWEGKLMATHLWLGPTSHISHRAAARLYGLDSYSDQPLLELTLAGTGRIRLAGAKIHRSKKLLSRDVRKVRGFACSAPERLLLELAAVVPDQMLEGAFDNLLLERMTTHRRVDTYLQRVRASGLNGVTKLEALLQERNPDQAPAESVFETEFYRFLREAAHPGARFQYEVFDSAGLVARLDVAYPTQKVGLEAHSVRWHSSAERVRKDAERHNRLTALGWRILYETYDNLKARPQEMLERLTRLLQEPVRPAADFGREARA